MPLVQIQYLRKLILHVAAPRLLLRITGYSSDQLVTCHDNVTGREIVSGVRGMILR